MNAVRIRKRLESAIPQLPELASLVGKDVEIIAREDRDGESSTSEWIQKTAGVCGGSACVLNTRIPVWTLIQLQRLGRTEQQLLTDFPSLTQSHLDAAWGYYRSNMSEIEADIAGQEEDEPAVDFG